MVKQTDFGFGVDAWAGPGGLSSPDSPLPSGPLRMTFVMGGNSHAGSRQRGTIIEEAELCVEGGLLP